MSDIAPSVQSAAAQAKSKPEHDTAGRFAKGNSGGPGNPFGGRAAKLRQVFLETVTDDDIRAIAKALVKKATEGCVPAAKIVLGHLLGKPGSYVPAPDRSELDLPAQNWEVMQQLARESGIEDLMSPSPNGNLRGDRSGKKGDGLPLPADLGNPANVSIVTGKAPSRGK